MLDRENSVVAAEAEIADHILPVHLVVAVAYCAEHPRAIQLVAVMLGIENAVLCGVVLVDLGILCVEVIDRALELTDSRNGIDALPDKVGGVEVSADNVANCRTELDKSLGVGTLHTLRSPSNKE